MRTSPRPTASSSGSSTKYKLPNISAFFLEKFPSWRRKSNPSIEPAQPESQDYVLTELQRKILKDAKESNSYSHSTSRGGIPPLLPSQSESKITSKASGKASSRHAKESRKILVASSVSRTPSESGNVVKITTNGKVNHGHTNNNNNINTTTPTKPATRLSYSDYQGSSQNNLTNSPSRKSLSNQDYSGSSAATENSVHESPRYSYTGTSSSRHSASPSSNVVIFGNTNTSSNSAANNANKSTAARTGSSILSSLGFPSIGAGNKTTTTATSAAPHTNVIAVKPAEYAAHSNTSTPAGSAHTTNSTVSASSTSSFNNQYAHPVHKHSASAKDNTATSSSGATSNTANTAASTAPSANANGIIGAGNSASPVSATVPAKVPAKPLCCDKCDGKHETDNCPYYKKKRDDHPDAQKNKQIGGVSSLPGNTLYSARVVRQPGDGSCLFHSMSYGLPSKSNAAKLRAEICQFIQNNPNLKISDTPLQDWVKWDANSSVGEYARKMSRGSWGGGIEMACVSQMKECNVHVYERSGMGFKRISAFDHPVSPESKPVVRVLYCGGVHYDAIVQ